MVPVKALYHDMLGLPIEHEEVYDGTVDICFLAVGNLSIELFADNPDERRPSWTNNRNQSFENTSR